MMTPWAALSWLLCALGLAPLVLSAAQALRHERDSLALAQATFLATDMANRLHLNAWAAPHYQLSWGQTPLAPQCLDSPCTRADWAASDLAHWRQRVGLELPEGDAWLQMSSDGSGLGQLVLAWTASAPVSGPVSAASSDMTCPARKRCLAMALVP